MSSTTINNPEHICKCTFSSEESPDPTSTQLFFAALICVTTAYIFHIPF
ncbi:MAG: hypothetical protein ACLTS1_07915 [Coprococcus sp.]